MGLTHLLLRLKQFLDGSSSFSVPQAPSEPAQRHAATATIHPNPPGTWETRHHGPRAGKGKHRAWSQQDASTAAQPYPGSTRERPAASPPLPLESNRLKQQQSRTLRDFIQTFLEEVKAAAARWVFFALALHTCKSVFFWPSLPPFLSSAPHPLHVLGATIRLRALYHFIRSRTALLAQHQLQREASSRPKQESQITLPPRGTWKREDKDAA